jgi:hypothetical protein
MRLHTNLTLPVDFTTMAPLDLPQKQSSYPSSIDPCTVCMCRDFKKQNTKTENEIRNSIST